MQRDPVELGAFYHELIGGELVLKNTVAKNRAGGRGHPPRNLTQRTAHRFHRTPVRPLRAGDDPQHFSQARWPAVFCPFPRSTVFTAVVAAWGRNGSSFAEPTAARQSDR